jgi:hypothetical protein
VSAFATSPPWEKASLKQSVVRVPVNFVLRNRIKEKMLK